LLGFPLSIGLFIRLILLIPSLIILNSLAVAGIYAAWISMWGILFTGRQPRGLFKLEVGALRWYWGVAAYIYNLFDDYPAMDLDQRDASPFRFEADYPESPERWLNLPFFPIKFLLLIPHFVVLIVLALLASIVLFIAKFAILFTGSFPAGMHSFLLGVLRWQSRVTGYLAAFTDKYPPFSLK
jgi:hypothetical protein